MLTPVASQHSPLKLKLQPRRPGPKGTSRDERPRNAQAEPGGSQILPLKPTPVPPGRLRLVGAGEPPAQKEWRLTMQISDNSVRLPGLAGAWRLFSAARAILALVGLTALLAVALPAPREALLQRIIGWSAIWKGQADNDNITAGTIQPGAEGAAAREQRAVTDFIAKRYRVAHDAVAGFVSAAYRAGTDWKVDPLLILAVMAVESRYNPVAESHMGAKGLMQVIPKFHLEKLADHGGESALLDPDVNVQVGARILREYLRRFGETETALQMYAGAFDEPRSQYAFKVLAERARLEQMAARQRRAP